MNRAIDISKQRRLKPVRRRSVFLSCSFGEREFVESLTRFLKREKFEVRTGHLVNGDISEAIRKRIKTCTLFLALMTRDEAKIDGTYTASPWIIAEIGEAIAFRKPIVLMVQEGVTRIDGIPGDLQQLRFIEKGFLNAALDAVEQLEAYYAEPMSKGA